MWWNQTTARCLYANKRIKRSFFHVPHLYVRTENKAVCHLTPPITPSVGPTQSHRGLCMRETEIETGRKEEMSGEGRVIRQRVCLCVYVLARLQLTASAHPEAMAISLTASQVAVLLSASWLAPSGPSQGLSTLLSSRTALHYCSALLLLLCTSTVW